MPARSQAGRRPDRKRRRTPGLRVAAGLVGRRGRLLLIQRPRRARRFPLQWEFPGGKLRPGETPAQALRRELQEELGIRARVGPLRAHYRHRYRNGLRVELWFFLVPGYRGRLRPRQAETHRWVPLRALSRYRILEGDRPLLVRLEARSRERES